MDQLKVGSMVAHSADRSAVDWADLTAARSAESSVVDSVAEWAADWAASWVER